MNDSAEKLGEQMAAFQKMWSDSTSQMLQALFTFEPTSAPPEVLRQIRSGIFQALGKSWEEFMRSPQFLETMKQWMEGAVAFRKMTNDLLANARSEAQATSRQDIDTVMLAVRHLEQRLLDRIEELSVQVALLQKPPRQPSPKAGAAQNAKTKRSSADGERRSRAKK